MKVIELGPIRPPSEAGSMLLRLTRNCPWNKCAFCHTYENTTCSVRDVSEIMKEIDLIRILADELESLLLKQSNINQSQVLEIAHTHETNEDTIYTVVHWMHNGFNSLFLQDADSLIMKTEDILRILNHIAQLFPTVSRITSYARSKTISRKSLDEMVQLKEAGLSRIHIGMESGSNAVLKVLEKGVTAQEHILAGRNVIESGMELSEYYIPGAGGKDLSNENATCSADVLNQIDPHYIRLRSVVPLPGTNLHDLMKKQQWIYPSEIEKVNEIELFISHLTGIRSIIKSDHIINLLEDVEGTFPNDKNTILQRIKKFKDMPDEAKLEFIVGRRLGYYRYCSDYAPNDKIKKITHKMVSHNSFNEMLLETLWNYI